MNSSGLMLARLAVRRMRSRPPCTLLLSRNHSQPNPNPNPNPHLSPNPNLSHETPAQASSDTTPELANYDFDRPGTVNWSRDLWGTVELCGKLDQDVTLYYLCTGVPIAKTLLKFGERNVWLTVVFKNDIAVVASAYLAKNDCILVSGHLQRQLSGPNWLINAYDFKCVLTEHHNGHIPEGFVREPQMRNLSEEGLQARWREFFKDPGLWRDNRSEKECLGRPDFEHKTYGYGLWVDGYDVPKWVSVQLQRLYGTPSDNGDVHACKDGNQQHGKLSQTQSRFSNKAYSAMIEKWWQDLFINSDRWIDNRRTKKIPNSPDFIQRSTGLNLWICSWETPHWALRQLAIQDSNAQNTTKDAPR